MWSVSFFTMEWKFNYLIWQALPAEGRFRSRRATDDRQTVSPSGSLPWTLSVGWVLAQIYTTATTTTTASTGRGVLFIRNEESTAHLKSNLLTVHATQIDEQGPQVLWIKQQQKHFCFYAPHAENKIKIHSLHGRMFVILSCHMNNSIKSILWIIRIWNLYKIYKFRLSFYF